MHFQFNKTIGVTTYLTGYLDILFPKRRIYSIDYFLLSFRATS